MTAEERLVRKLKEEAEENLREAKAALDEAKEITEKTMATLEGSQELMQRAQTALILRELDKVEYYCKGRGFNYKREDSFDHQWHHLVIVYDEYGNRLWDASCAPGTYGYEQGKLEILGDIVFEDDPEGAEGVVGWLTADDVIDRIERLERGV